MIVNVNWFFNGLFSPSTFDKIIINFPDPWPKKKHHKHRFVSNPLLESLSVVSKANTQLQITTDHYEYIQKILFDLTNTKHWINFYEKGVLLSQTPSKYKSFFHIKKEKEGCFIYYLQFVYKGFKS